MATSYGELLRDPRWQRKRLEILARDNWKCTNCGEHEIELQVHHRYYAKDRAPWEYEDHSLVTLCGNCHEYAEHLRLQLVKTAGLLDFERSLRVVGYAEGLSVAEVIDQDMAISFRGPWHLLGFCEALGIDAEAAVSCFGKDHTASLRALQSARSKRSAA